MKPQTQANHLANAQYSLCGRERQWGAKSFVAHGLTWTQARTLQARLEKQINRFWPGPHFGDPTFSPSLRMPVFFEAGAVEPGDFVVRAVQTLALSTLMTVSIAQAVETDGLILREMSGNVLTYSGRYWVFPVSQFDAPAVQGELFQRWARHVKEQLFGQPWGFFDSAKSVGYAIRMFLKPVEIVLPSSAEVSRIIEFPVEVGGWTFDNVSEGTE